MTFSIQYKPFFEVQVLHNYFLNKGAVLFSAMSESDKQKRLAKYNMSHFISIEPDVDTISKLKGFGLVFKTDSTGFKIWSRVEIDGITPFVSIDDDTYFTFLIRTSDSRFYNYTSLKMEHAGRLYYFSNRKPDGAPLNFSLISRSGENIKTDETKLLNQELQNAVTKKLTAAERNGLFAMVRIYVKGDSSVLNITDLAGGLKSPSPVFELLFDNRKSTWRYIFRTTQVVKPADDVKKEDGNAKILVTKSEMPLTEGGFISVELGNAELPNPGIDRIVPDTENDKYYSEIYM